MNSTIRTRVFVSSCVCTFLFLIFLSSQSWAIGHGRVNEKNFKKISTVNYLSSDLSANLAIGSSHEGEEATTESSVNGQIDKDEVSENESSAGAMEAICPPPIINTQPQSITTCLGSSVVFSVVANTNGPGTIVYQWKKGAANISGATGSSFTITSVTVANAGSYTVAVTKSCGATVTSVAAVLTINNVDGGTINGAQTICVGVTAAAITSASNGSGAGTLSYQWEESPDLSSWSPIGGATGLTYSPGALTSTKHFRRAVESLLNGITCDAYSNIISITVTQVTASVWSNSPVCEGSLLALQATGGVSYSWSGPDGFSGTQQNPGISNVALSASGTYSVTVTNASGCSATVSAAVTINPKPTPTATNNSPLCEGASLSLSSCGGTSFLWEGPASFSSTAKSSSIGEVSMANAGDYNVIVTNSYGCTGVAVTMVVVNPGPAVAANNNGPLCEGGEATLTASGGNSYSWTGPNGFSSSNQNPIVSITSLVSGGTYVATVTNSYGCSATAPTTVVINAAPSVTISSLNEVNVGGLISLNSDGGVTYQWSGPNGFTSTEQNPNISDATLAQGGTYTVVVTSSEGCNASASISITVIPAPPAAASSDGPADEGGTITLSAGEGEAFYWEGPNGFTSTEQTVVIENASSENAGTYTVTVTDANGNTYVSSTDVVIFPAPSAASNSPACEGSIINLSADGGNSYSWAGPNGFTSTEQNPIIETSSLTNAGTYTATVTRSDGSTRTATVSVAINPSYNVTASPVVSCDDYTLAWNQTVTSSGEYSHRYASVHGCDSVVTVNVTINSSYNLEGAAVTACDNHTLPWGTNVTASGDYSHTYTSLNGCDSVVSIHVAINATYHITEPAVNACDSHTLPWGEVVTATGDYSHTYSSITTCDSTINVHVNVHSSYNVTGAAVSACDSHTLPWGDVVTSEGNYRHTYSSVSGCDSTVTIYVDVHNSYNVVGVPVKDCDSHTMPWGTVVTTSGDYTHTYTTAGGCDSTVAIHVTINHRYNLTGNAVTSCTSYTLPWGEVATTTDNYDYTYTAVGGCDSTVTIHVTINPVYNTTTASVSACNSYALPWGVTANASGDYSHLYTSVNGCDSTVSLHVTINNSASSSWNATACDSYNLPCGGSVTSSGNYAHTYSTVNGCDSVVTAHITINHSYNVNGASATACNSYTLPWGATVAGSGNYSHHYNAIAGCDSLVTIHVTINSSAASSFNATACGSYSLPWGGSVTSSGNYSHTYSTVNGCDSVVTANITINGYPVVAASGNTACAGATLNLTASGGTTYSWSGPNSFTSSLQNPSINGATTSMSGTYTVTVTNASGCSAVATASATVNALPVATASANSICAGGTLNFTSGGGSSYSWSGPNGFTSSIQNPTRTNATSIMSGTYTVTVTNASGCSATATANATVNALPSATASSNSVCVGGTLNLISSGGSTYSWSGPNSFTSALQNPSRTNATSLMSGTYTVTVTNASGCSANTTVAASVNANASPSITGNNTICSGSNTTFDAGSGYSSYLWSTGATTQTISVSTATTYTVTVTNSSGCSGSASRSLAVNSIPAAPAVAVVNNCNGTSTLTASGFTGALAWSNGGSDNPHIVSTAASYTVTQTLNGCTSPASSAVTAAPKTTPAVPTVSVVNNCGGTSTLTASGYTGTLAWSSGGSSNPKVVSSAGNYTVTQSVNGCVSPASVTVTAAPKASPTCSITSSNSCVLGGVQNSFTAAANMDAYSWSVSGCGSSISGSHTSSSVKINSSNTNGSYTVTLTVTDNGCSSTCTKTVTVKQSKDVCQYSCLYTTGSGYHPTCTKTPIYANFKVYDMNTCGGPNGRQDNYSNVWNSSSGQITYCNVSDPVQVNYGGGPCYRYTISVPDDQKCLILGQSTVSSSYYQGGSCTVFTGNKVNDDDDDIDPCTNNTLKFNCVIKDYNNKCREGSSSVQWGSELLIISPAALEFTDSTENLPVVYESVAGAWSAEVSPTPPEGFYAIPDSSLSATVTDSVIDAVQFTIVDTGSVWTYTQLLHKLHHNGAERITYSNPLMINQRTNKLTGINIYPNPASGSIIINLPLFEGKAKIFVHDINGQKVMEQNIKIVDGSSVSMDVSKLAAGIYLISVENDEGRIATKLIKERE